MDANETTQIAAPARPPYEPRIVFDAFHQVGRLFQALSVAGLGGIGVLGARSPCIQAKFLLDAKSINGAVAGGAADCHLVFNAIDWLSMDLLIFGLVCLGWTACLFEACFSIFFVQRLVAQGKPLEREHILSLASNVKRQKILALFSALMTSAVVADTYWRFEEMNVFAEAFIAAGLLLWWMVKRVNSFWNMASCLQLRKSALAHEMPRSVD